jgi:hypothetical protein
LPLRYVKAVSLLVIVFASVAPAQSGSSAPVDITALVRRAVEHRLDDERRHRPIRYDLHKKDEHLDTTKAIIETAEGDVARLLAVDGKPLAPDSEAGRAELDRLDELVAHPEQQERRRRNEQKDAQRISHILALLPDAFVYHFETMDTCAEGQCVRLSFTPNPHFTPPDLESDLLRGVAGEMWIDQAQERFSRIDAHLIAEVNFGFGVIGKINRGGTIRIEQADIGGQDWELTRLNLHITGKILMLKSLHIDIDEETSHFASVPTGLNYRDAIQMLKRLPFN